MHDEEQQPPGHSFAGRSFCARAQSSAVSRRAYGAYINLGSMEPLGFFDPSGFSTGDEANFRNLRAAEIKHGRVSMMAAVGAVAQHYVKFPGFENVPVGMGAVTTEPGNFGVAALFLVSGALSSAFGRILQTEMNYGNGDLCLAFQHGRGLHHACGDAPRCSPLFFLVSGALELVVWTGSPNREPGILAIRSA